MLWLHLTSSIGKRRVENENKQTKKEERLCKIEVMGQQV